MRRSAQEKGSLDMTEKSAHNGPDIVCPRCNLGIPGGKQLPAETPSEIIANARAAKQFLCCADVDPVPDEALVRAAVVFNMLARKGFIVGPLDDLDLPHAITIIAGGFTDDPPSTPHRADLFATDLGDAG